jgi:photosystem II stability/assembly factor-like uncharacterized protein
MTDPRQGRTLVSATRPSMTTKTFLACTGPGLARAACANGHWSVEHLLPGQPVTCLSRDPLNPGVVYAGTQAGAVLRSTDYGHTWAATQFSGGVVKALAASPTEPGVVYAGTKPPALFASRDAGAHWSELEAFRRVRAFWWFSPAEAGFKPYVQGLALSPTDSQIIVAGIEAAAVVRSADGGQSWQAHRPGAVRDCHSLTFHARQGDWVYEGGGTGVAISRDGGRTWRQPRAGLDRRYCWACAADPARPEVWYVSASPMFAGGGRPVPAAHVEGEANAYIFRSAGGAAWEKLGGGLPQPLSHMAYALLTDPAAPGHVYAGLSSGDVWHSTDHGDTWQQLPFNLGGIQRTLVML